jgi:hypothetical protein
MGAHKGGKAKKAEPMPRKRLGAEASTRKGQDWANLDGTGHHRAKTLVPQLLGSGLRGAVHSVLHSCHLCYNVSYLFREFFYTRLCLVQGIHLCVLCGVLCSVCKLHRAIRYPPYTSRTSPKWASALLQLTRIRPISNNWVLDLLSSYGNGK